jgi:hypothetical protein
MLAVVFSLFFSDAHSVFVLCKCFSIIKSSKTIRYTDTSHICVVFCAGLYEELNMILQSAYTVVPPYLLIQYPQFQLSVVYRSLKKFEN